MKNNQLTPMQEAIEKLKEKKNMFEKATKSHSDIRGTYQIAILVLESLLPKEQQVIEDFAFEVIKRGILLDEGKISEEEITMVKNDVSDYYNTKFKNNGK